MISTKLKPFGTTIFAEMTKLAQQHGAINLAQGFPDFDGPLEIIDWAEEAMRGGQNQYARSMGHPDLVLAIAATLKRDYALEYDPMTEIGVFCGATEGIASSLLGLLNPGDEVILFEPFYDSYPACVAMAGAVPRFCTLHFPEFEVPMEELRALFTDKTRLLVINNPHNPSGKVFRREELEAIAGLCIEHDVPVVCDEVYEHLVYDDARQVPMASIPGMKERTLRISSSGKTYSYTGWKIGWASGPAPMVAAAQAAHQFITFAVATPFQVAMARALTRLGPDFHRRLRSEYSERRIFLLEVLRRCGLRVAVPRGAYFVLADFTPIFSGTDMDFARFLASEIGVAAIPPSVFYKSHPEEGQQLVRFAFCKRMETLKEAAQRMQKLERHAAKARR